MITSEQLDLHAKWLRGEPDGVRLVMQGANLQGANLQGANLQDAIIRGANLQGADLWGANLRGAFLWGANLQGADLWGANLQGAIIRGANLRGATGLCIAADASERLRAVAAAALSSDNALEMKAWHTCTTTHCIAGWAIHQAGEPGRLLRQQMGAQIAGLMLLGIEAHSHFFDSDDDARQYLQSVLEGSHD